MRSNTMAKPTSNPAVTCPHRWIIEPANGPVSRGKCVRCQSSRDFYNDPELVVRDRLNADER
jgi:hypothetical protein